MKREDKERQSYRFRMPRNYYFVKDEQENDDVQILFQVTRADENGSRDVTNVGDVKNMGNVRDVSLFLLERTSSPFSTLTKKHTKCIC